MEVEGQIQCMETKELRYIVQQWSMEFYWGLLVIRAEAWRGICTIESSSGHNHTFDEPYYSSFYVVYITSVVADGNNARLSQW